MANGAAITLLPAPPILCTPYEAARTIAEQGGGLAVFSRAGLRPLIEAVDNHWRQFAGSPSEAKQPWTVRCKWDDPSQGADNGWVPRHGDRPSGDDVKEFFHIRPPLRQWLKNRQVRLEPWQKRFIVDAQVLYHALLDQMYQFGEGLDVVLPGYNFAERLREESARPKGRAEHVLRVLYYRNVEFPGQELAHIHVDRCLFTFHVADSRPGLVIVQDGQEFLVETRPDTIAVFCGTKAVTLSDGRLKALPHRVVSPELAGTNVGRRTSTVFFSHALTAGSLLDTASQPY